MGAAANTNANESDADDDGMAKVAKGCSEKRAAKKKGKSMFSLQDLLCSDLKKATTVAGKGSASKAKRTPKKGGKAAAAAAVEAAEEAEFEAFIK